MGILVPEAAAYVTELVINETDGSAAVWLGGASVEWLKKVTETAFRLLVVALLIATNGFFASAEVALLSVRSSRLRQMAEEKVVGAPAALQLLASPERLLSLTQVGVTATSLGLGWAGEDTLYQLLVQVLQPGASPVSARLLHGFGFV